MTRRRTSPDVPPQAKNPRLSCRFAVQAAIAMDDHHINHSVLGASQAIPQHEQTRRLRRDPPTEIAIDDHHINHSVLGANQAIPQHEQTCHLRRDPPTEDDVRNAIERATVSAKRIEIVLSESIVAEGQDRVLTLPWTRTSSRRRREIIQRVGEAQQPLRAMRTKARDGFMKALRDAHRWLDELLVDPTQTIDTRAVAPRRQGRRSGPHRPATQRSGGK